MGEAVQQVRREQVDFDYTPGHELFNTPVADSGVKRILPADQSL